MNESDIKSDMQTEEKQLKGKRILFFAPAFFDYEKEIAEKMKKMGADVVFYDERSITGPMSKALLKINPKVFYRKTQQYYKNIINAHKNEKYDFVFFIKCEMPTEGILKRLREVFQGAKFCLYLYDSIKNIRGIKQKFKFFDVVSSFDLNDCEKNVNINFRPLFFIDKYQTAFEGNNPEDYQYDITFCGTIHSDRYDIIRRVEEYCRSIGAAMYTYCYLQSRFIFYIYRVTKKGFHKAEINRFSFSKLDAKSIADIVGKSRAVLDIQHPKQTGLTMRTCEMIGMHKKLITTNKDIVKYDFYHPDNILLIDRNKIDIPKAFMSKPYRQPDGDVYQKYTLQKWILNVLDFEKYR